MEAFKQKMQRRSNLCRLYIVLCALLMAAGVLRRPTASNYIEFLRGGLLGLEIVLFFYWTRLSRALQTEEKLRELYVKDQDEREKFIWNEAARVGMWGTFGALVLAGIVVMYFAPVVAAVLIVSGCLPVLLAKLARVYLRKKY